MQTAYLPKGPIVQMQNRGYWPNVPNLAGSFSKAKFTICKHTHINTRLGRSF